LKRFLSVLLATFIITQFLSAQTDQPNTLIANNTIVLENDSIKVSVDAKIGSFTVTEKISGKVWSPDPWDKTAGLLTLRRRSGTSENLIQTANVFSNVSLVNDRSNDIIIDISKGSTITVEKINNHVASVRFVEPDITKDEKAKGVIIESELHLHPTKAQLDVKITEYESTEFNLVELRYPARQFSLLTDIDKGAGVIPQWQGLIAPSYIFPMSGGSFCQWDDATYDVRSVGTLGMYQFVSGLSMPWWWGTYNEKSAVIAILNQNPQASMYYNINNNGQEFYNKIGKMSPNPRILFLDPVLNLQQRNLPHEISYRFIPDGNYVDMAKEYRKIAKERGYFKSLKEKAAAKPDVNKLAGAIYLGIYGGYPHYVNMLGMAFTFDQLKGIIQDTYENLKVDNAIVHAWGVHSNYPPYHWPISEELGGVEKLKAAVDLAKDAGYLYASYRAYSPRLENDPDFNLNLVSPKSLAGSRWSRVQSKYFKELAEKTLPKEMEAIGQNADITDILFIGTPDTGRIELAKYLTTTGLVTGTERGQESWIPYMDFFEGMTYFYDALEGVDLANISHKAPLFNLVYHDAIGNFGKIQDPDNLVTFNGDFRIKSLRNILIGNGTLIFFSPYEYEGVRNMIKIANELVAPVHRETFYDELLSHEYLSPDFMVQHSYFSGGTQVTVKLGPVDQIIESDVVMPALDWDNIVVALQDHDVDVQISGNHFSNHRARGILIKTPGKVRLHDNYINAQGAAIKVHIEASSWHESGPVDDVEIYNNVIDQCNNGGFSFAAIEISADVTDPESVALVHKNISIHNNKIIYIFKPILDASYVENLEFYDNEIIPGKDYQQWYKGNAEPEMIVINKGVTKGKF